MKKILFAWLVPSIAWLILSFPVQSEEVDVKYKGMVDISDMDCWEPDSSFVKRLCYRLSDEYVVVKLNTTYYHYCDMPSEIFSAWLNSRSLGSFYNGVVKGNFSCRFMP